MTAYREYTPRPELREIVESLWLQKSDAAPPSERATVLPTGRTELILHYADPFAQYRGDRVELMPLFHAVGQHNKPIHLNATGRMRIVIVRFKPSAATALFGGMLPELENRIVDLDLIWPPRHLERLGQQMVQAATDRRRIEFVQEFVLQRLLQSDQDGFCNWVLQTMRLNPGRCRVAALARMMGVSRRQLTRRFSQTVGMSPKKMLGVLRAQAAIVGLRSGSGAHDVVADCGYADQAHLIHDLAVHSGKKPGEIIRHQCSPLQRFFNTRVQNAYRGFVYL